jgi:hypothetical protein
MSTFRVFITQGARKHKRKCCLLLILLDFPLYACSCTACTVYLTYYLWSIKFSFVVKENEILILTILVGTT